MAVSEMNGKTVDDSKGDNPSVISQHQHKLCVSGTKIGSVTKLPSEANRSLRCHCGQWQRKHKIGQRQTSWVCGIGTVGSNLQHAIPDPNPHPHRTRSFPPKNKSVLHFRFFIEFFCPYAKFFNIELNTRHCAAYNSRREISKNYKMLCSVPIFHC